MFMKRLIVTLLFFPFFAPFASASEWWNSGGGATWYEEGPEWKESEVVLPDYPEEDNLLAFEVDNPSSNHHYFLDSASLSIGDDLVIRYSALIRTRSGATNVFHDGIRCQTREYKNYAFGVNGAFIENEGAAWERVQGYDFFRKALMRDVLCEPTNRARPVAEVVNKLKYGR